MKIAKVNVQGRYAGQLEETPDGRFVFTYLEGYLGPPVSLTMPTHKSSFEFHEFPPFFEGLLPEGALLNALLQREKIGEKDFFTQLLIVGKDLVGDVTVENAEGFDS